MLKNDIKKAPAQRLRLRRQNLLKTLNFESQ